MCYKLQILVCVPCPNNVYIMPLNQSHYPHMIKEETYDKVINEYVHANKTEIPKKSEKQNSVPFK